MTIERMNAGYDGPSEWVIEKTNCQSVTVNQGHPRRGIYKTRANYDEHTN